MSTAVPALPRPITPPPPPALQQVLGSTAAQQQQDNAAAQSGALGTAISSGAFGGDRAGIGAANLKRQQDLANAQIYSNIENQGFNTALGAAQQQQGVQLQAGQANRAATQSCRCDPGPRRAFRSRRS